MIGNDVVDLGDPDARPGATHARFDARVFAPAERDALAASAAPTRLRWRLWAGKEAAYKAARRRDERAIFSPSRFVVTLYPAAHGIGRGLVVHHRLGAFRLWIDERPQSVHALAFAAPHPADEPAAAYVWGVGRSGADPSASVRRLAIASVARALGEAPSAFAVIRRGRIPQLERHGVPAAALSLSHHGRFVAFACRVGAPT